MTTPSRILVYLQRFGNDNKPHLARFTQCIIDYFEGDKTKFTTSLYPELVSNQLIITDKSDSITPVKIKHPSFCPIRNLSQLEDNRLPDEIKERGIDVGAAVILESADNKILLTRRSKNLRTFPGVWVPPGGGLGKNGQMFGVPWLQLSFVGGLPSDLNNRESRRDTRFRGTLRIFLIGDVTWIQPSFSGRLPSSGHIEMDETLIQAGLRELEEETGLKIQPTQCVDEQVHIISLWESVFPTKLSMGQPKRHHVVIYLHAKLRDNWTSDILDQQMKLNPDEVGASAWLDLPTVQAIVAACEEKCVDSTPGSHIPLKVKGFVINDQGKQEEAMLPTQPLMTVSGDKSDSERVSTGTKFALEEWLALQR